MMNPIMKSALSASSAIILGEWIVCETRKMAEKYISIDPDVLITATREQLLPHIHRNMKEFTPLFILGSAFVGLGVSSLAAQTISYYQNKDGAKKEHFFSSGVGKVILGCMACMARAHFCLKAPQ